MKKGKLKILIITFLILFPVIIIFTIFNKTGIISNIITKNEKNSESEARAKLESILETAANEKTNNSSYNSNDFLTNLLEQENIVVKDNIVSLNNYNFVIDRDNLSISENLGETSVNVSYDISNYFSDITADNQNVASAKINIKSNIVIDSITFENSDGTLDVEPVNNTTFSKDINIIHNKEYSLTVTTCDGKVNFKTYKEDISEKTDSLISSIQNGITKSGYYKIAINNEVYDIHAYVYDDSTVFSSNQSFGDENDIATSDSYAKNMILLKVFGDLTIDSDVLLTTYNNSYGSTKGLFIFVTGTLINNGTISMSARGAKAISQNIYLWQNYNSTYEYIPSIGGAGGNKVYCNNKFGGTNGTNGENGTNRATGGGGSGGATCSSSYSGAGSIGTSYSGGTGGGGSWFATASAGSSVGGQGGNGNRKTYDSNWTDGVGGGAGNPGGSGFGSGYHASGANGTGGLLIIYGNTIINNGTISSNGSNGGNAYRSGGGGSGGGSINIFYLDSFTSGSIVANRRSKRCWYSFY